jgi:hypothetical protein
MEDQNAADHPSPVTIVRDVLLAGRTVAGDRKAIRIISMMVSYSLSWPVVNPDTTLDRNGWSQS